jgi:hypothetical protein
MATRADPSGPFEEVVALDELNTEFVETPNKISLDGLKMYFIRTDDVFRVPTWSEVLFATRSSRGERFSEPHVLEELRVPGRIVVHLAASEDDLTLVLHVEGGGQAPDLYETTRDSTELRTPFQLHGH